MKKFLRHNWPLVLIVALSGLILWPLFVPGYFSHHDNLQVIRIFEMRRCFTDLQIPCRWVPDMGYGYGFPMFNYYGVLPYYIGALVSYVVGFVISAKFLFFIPLILGGISMYFLAKEIFSKEVGFVSAILFLFAPYRALDSYVRGAIDESFAIAIIPIVFYFCLRLIRKSSLKNFLGFTISLGIFLICHNLMTVTFIPILVVWLVFWLVMERKTKIWPLVIGFVLGIGLASFFIFPAYFEKNLVQINNLKENIYIPNFRAHFVTLRQLFISRFWGYGASTWGENDGISFQVGWPHWWLAIVSLFIAGYGLVFSKKRDKKFFTQYLLIILMFLTFLFSVFMTHNKSAFIWERIDTLQFFQFPWRFLSLSVFSVSLIGGFIVSFTKGYFKAALITVIVITTVYLNYQYFRPDKFFPTVTDQTSLSGPDWDYQRQGAILDYLPTNAKVPANPAPDLPNVVIGEAKISDFVNKSNRWEFNASVIKDSTIEVPVFDFPGWKVFLNGKEIVHTNDNVIGRIGISLLKGESRVEGRFTDTPIRILGNTLTGLSILLLVLIYVKIHKTFAKVN